MSKPKAGKTGLQILNVDAEQPFVFLNHVAIRHAGEVIAYCAMQAIGAYALARLLADFARMRKVELEQLGEHTHGARVGFVHLRAEVEVAIEILSEFEVLRAAPGAVLDER